jgi:formate dehydrogenase subunit delta
VSAPDRLVQMANQIAANLAVRGEAAAANQMAQHVKSFWDKRMRAAIQRHLQAGGLGLSPIARRALDSLRETP